MRKNSPSLLILAAALAASPALAHHDEAHGLPGALHSVSADHSGWILVAAVTLLAAFALRRPILRALKVRSRR